MTSVLLFRQTHVPCFFLHHFSFLTVQKIRVHSAKNHQFWVCSFAFFPQFSFSLSFKYERMFCGLVDPFSFNRDF